MSVIEQYQYCIKLITKRYMCMYRNAYVSNKFIKGFEYPNLFVFHVSCEHFECSQ